MRINEYTIKENKNSRGEMIFEDNPIFASDDDRFNQIPYVSQLAYFIRKSETYII